ncbi:MULTISPECIES: hypothetical protein [Streptomyces]|uniref:Uncharacterized protein n=1 Tax=Streptomyces ochraceiscleroticus TaxID=47761 RepID=A0ABW1MSJ1_9ACTN|nr:MULTISPECIES: hypothetical protein [Streptomyces]MBZ4018075.1 hypothetical protein [Streptomyces purpurogeneiscleroticus]
MDKQSRPEPEDLTTPDRSLHSGPSADATPEDLVMATGRDLTPKNLEWARRKLAAEGQAAVEKILP